MPAGIAFCLRLAGIILAGMIVQSGYPQCSPQQQNPPVPIQFRSGITATDGTDKTWKIAIDSINGTYSPAIPMKGLSSAYPHAANWISFSETGQHTGDHYFYFKTDFNLPCYDLCGNSYDSANTFCLNLDLYCDNSIYEIFVNGVPQSPSLANVPLANPFNPINHNQSDSTTVSLCRNWKAGANSLVIVVASSATIMGLMVEPAASPPPPPNAYSVSASICEGEHYVFGSRDLTQPGVYTQTFTRPGLCDSIVALTLTVNHPSAGSESKVICQGQNYQGHSESGIYTSHFTNADGCDSVHQIELTVLDPPHPVLPSGKGLCAGDSIVLDPGQFDTYTWQDGSANMQYVVRQTGVYRVTVSNRCGTASASTVVADGHCGLYFPNAFSPNGNGHNDVFRAISDLSLADFELRIFNRWGQLVFESRDPHSGWDGTVGRKLQPSGTYVWQCRARLNGRLQLLQGTLQLIY